MTLITCISSICSTYIHTHTILSTALFPHSKQIEVLMVIPYNPTQNLSANEHNLCGSPTVYSAPTMKRYYKIKYFFFTSSFSFRNSKSLLNYVDIFLLPLLCCFRWFANRCPWYLYPTFSFRFLSKGENGGRWFGVCLPRII